MKRNIFYKKVKKDNEEILRTQQKIKEEDVDEDAEYVTLIFDDSNFAELLKQWNLVRELRGTCSSCQQL